MEQWNSDLRYELILWQFVSLEAPYLLASTVFKPELLMRLKTFSRKGCDENHCSSERPASGRYFVVMYGYFETFP
jgi:hypothetical protein